MYSGLKITNLKTDLMSGRLLIHNSPYRSLKLGDGYEAKLRILKDLRNYSHQLEEMGVISRVAINRRNQVNFEIETDVTMEMIQQIKIDLHNIEFMNGRFRIKLYFCNAKDLSRLSEEEYESNHLMINHFSIFHDMQLKEICKINTNEEEEEWNLINSGIPRRNLDTIFNINEILIKILKNRVRTEWESWTEYLETYIIYLDIKTYNNNTILELKRRIHQEVMLNGNIRIIYRYLN